MITWVNAVVRGMRGDSHSYLLGTKDGNHYVTKFAWNTAARRRLINEWIGSNLLDHLGVATPKSCLVQIEDAFWTAHEHEFGSLSQKISALPGPHFGSQFPGSPDTTTVYDFLPAPLMNRVGNLNDFLGSLVFDLWCGKATRRQAVFIKDTGHPGLRALMIDHGDLFGGTTWSLIGAQPGPTHLGVAVYSGLAGMSSLEPWFAKIEGIAESLFQDLATSVPTEWVNHDRLALDSLLSRLSASRSQIRSRVRDYLHLNQTFFPSSIEEQPVRRDVRSELRARPGSVQYVA